MTSTPQKAFTVGPSMTERQAREIFAKGEEAVVFALLQLTQQLAEQAAKAAATGHDTPSTPSGMKPPYTKPSSLLNNSNWGPSDLHNPREYCMFLGLEMPFSTGC